ncbi:signal peptidase I [bacterium]|nr:signal peptidase I [bacterium]
MNLLLNDTNIIFVNRDFAFYLTILVVVCAIAKTIKRYYPAFLDRPAFINQTIRFIGITFWELLAVLIIRGFFYEMYLIPSGSMQPSLYPGDFVLVNKYEYGFKVPGLNTTIAAFHPPERGDVVVFLQPDKPTQRKMIKRMIGLPGDHIKVEGQKLTINGQLMATEFKNQSYEYLSLPQHQKIRIDTYFHEQKLGSHDVVIETIPALHKPFDLDFIVPQGHYFVLGDNRDNSQDSRYWGFVPERFLCGKAQYVILSFSWKDYQVSFKRVGRLV